MLSAAKCLLEEIYSSCTKEVQDSVDHVLNLKYKQRHSFQVLGVANFLIKHEKYFQQKDSEFIELAKSAVLLHDIGRAKEILLNYNKCNNLDHGILGYQELINNSVFSDIRIVLPIKHHGHLREKIYSDNEFQNIDDQKLKEEVEAIFWLIRDADKNANMNMHMLKNRFLNDNLRFKFIEKQNLPISSKVFSAFKNYEIIDSNNVESLQDRLLQIIAFKFELYYLSSHQFLFKNNIENKLWDILEQYCLDKNEFSQLKNHYLAYGNRVCKL